MRNREDFSWGSICRQGHTNSSGTNLRYKNICVMCERGRVWGDRTQEEILEYLTTPKPPKRTPEEVRALQVAASMRWNAKNKDKTAEYAKRYQQKPERRAIVNARRKEQYESQQRIPLTPEQIAAREELKRQKEAERQAKRTPEYLAAKKAAQDERRREYQRELYARMTQEEKQEMMAKRRAREQRKKDGPDA